MKKSILALFLAVCLTLGLASAAFAAAAVQPTISPTTATFSLSENEDEHHNIVVTKKDGSYTFVGVKNGAKDLPEGAYTVKADTVTIKLDYLCTIPAGSAALTFDYSGEIDGVPAKDPVLRLFVTGELKAPATPIAIAGGQVLKSGKTLSVGRKITLTCETPGATIYYTLNNHDYTYTEPIVLTSGIQRFEIWSEKYGVKSDVLQLRIKAASDGDDLDDYDDDDDDGGKKTSDSDDDIDDVILLIAAIGEVTEKSGPKITAARKAYDALTSAQKRKVSNYRTLLNAELLYSQLTDPLPFTDVGKNAYYYDAVDWCFRNNITNGTSETTFSPADSCTRGQVVTFLWRAMGKPEPVSTVNPFTDVKEDDYFYKPVLWAVEQGITNGTSETSFSPKQTCSYAHILTFLWRAVTGERVWESGPWYEGAQLWATDTGIMKGMTIPEDIAGADAFCPRADVVTFLYRHAGSK